MKTILCYGDSNTWGLDYRTGGRYPFEERWTTILQRRLGDGFQVVAEGLNGRTAGKDDPGDEDPEAKNGRRYLIPCLRSHCPVDLMVLMLGTNDLKTRFFTAVDDVAEDIGTLIQMTRRELGAFQGYRPKILLVAPMAVGDTIETSVFREEFGGKKAIAPSVELAGALRRVAAGVPCDFLNAAEITEPNEVDAIHFSPEGHEKFGEAVAEWVRETFA